MDQDNPQHADESQPNSKRAQARGKSSDGVAREAGSRGSDAHRDENPRDHGANNAARAFEQIRR